MLLLLPLYSLVPLGIADSCIFIILSMPSHSLISSGGHAQFQLPFLVHQFLDDDSDSSSPEFSDSCETMPKITQLFALLAPGHAHHLQRDIRPSFWIAFYSITLSHSLRLDQHHTQVEAHGPYNLILNTAPFMVMEHLLHKYIPLGAVFIATGFFPNLRLHEETVWLLPTSPRPWEQFSCT